MLDIRNRRSAEVSQADDFIVSDKLVSLLLTQVAENKQLHAVFQDLFISDGSEVYLWPASQYVRLDSAVNFYYGCGSRPPEEPNRHRVPPVQLHPQR